jgi:hypothetical protein
MAYHKIFAKIARVSMMIAAGLSIVSMLPSLVQPLAILLITSQKRKR